MLRVADDGAGHPRAPPAATCSSASTAPTPRARSGSAAPGWACRSSSTSPSVSAAGPRLRSREGFGTTITVTLPGAPPPPEDDREDPSRLGRASGDRAPVAGRDSVPRRPMTVPLMDIQAQYGPLRARDRRRRRGGARQRALHPRPRGPGPRGGRLGAPRRPALRGRRQRHRRPRHRAQRPGHRAGRRGHHDPVHLLRHGRGHRAGGRHAGLLRHRPGHLLPRPRRRCEARIGPATRAILPVHIFGHPADMPPIMDAGRASTA